MLTFNGLVSVCENMTDYNGRAHSVMSRLFLGCDIACVIGRLLLDCDAHCVNGWCLLGCDIACIMCNG